MALGAVQYVTLRARIRHGWEPEAAISMPALSRAQAEARRVAAVRRVARVRHGAARRRAAELYKRGESFAQIAVQLQVAAATVRGWGRADGWLPPAVPGPSRGRVAAYGEVNSVRGWAADPRCQVSENALRHRLNHGWDPELAISTPPAAAPEPPEHRHLPDTLTHRRQPDAEQTKHPVKAANAENLQTAGMVAAGGSCTAQDGTCGRIVYSQGLCRPHRERQRRGDPDWDRPIRRRGRPVAAFGQAKSTAAWAGDERCVVPLETLRQRLAEGWEPQRAISTPLMTPRQVGAAFGAAAARAGLARRQRARQSHEQGHTVAQIAADLGVTQAAVVRWGRADGWLPAGKSRPRTRVTAFGVTKTVRAWARDERCPVSAQTLYNRIREGWVIEQAITTPPAPGRVPDTVREQREQRAAQAGPHARPTRPNAARGGRQAGLIRAFGEDRSINEWAADARCSVTSVTLRNRLRGGMDPEQAITMPDSRGRRPRRRLDPELALTAIRLFKAGGTRRHIAAVLGVPAHVVGDWIRVAEATGPTRRAAGNRWRPGPPVRARRGLIEAFGQAKTAQEWLADPRCTVVNTGTLRSRLARGWPPETALTAPFADMTMALTARGRTALTSEQITELRAMFAAAKLHGKPPPVHPSRQADQRFAAHLAQLIADGHTCHELAKAIGTGNHTITSRLRRHGHPTHPPTPANAKP